MRRKSYILLALLLVVSLLGAACQRQQGDDTTTGEEPQVGGTLVVGWDQEPKILNPFITGGDLFATAVVANMVLRGAHRITPDLEFEPFMVTRTPSTDNGDIKINGDKMSVTWTLRDDLKWSDGTQITAADFEFTWQVIMDQKNDILSREGYDLIESVDSSDPQKFTVNFKQLYNQWILLFNQILPKHELEGKDFNTQLLESMGVASGPFQFKEWKKGDSISLVRNENYWGEHKAYLDEVVFRYIADTAALKNAFQASEVHFIQPPPDVAQVDEIRAFQNVEVEVAAGVIWEHLGFNHEHPDLSKLEVRQAIAYAIDREQLVAERLKGQVEPLNSFVVPQLEKFHSDPWSKYKKDVNKAKELLAKAGYGPDKPLTLTIGTTSGNKAREDNEAFFQQELKEVGIDLKIENFEAATFFGDRLPAGNFHIGEWAWLGSPGYAGAASLVELFAPDQIPPEGQNYYRYKSDKIGDIKSKLQTTLDEDEGAKMLKDAQKIMADDMAFLPLYQRIDAIAYIDRLRGPVNNATQEGPFWNIEDWWLGTS